MTAALHDLERLDVGDLQFRVAPPSNRTTLEITVERDATLTLRAPSEATVERAEQFVTGKKSWIYRKLAEKDALIGPPIVKQFVDGEGFAYLGRSHRLLIDPQAEAIRLDRGRFVAPPHVQSDGPAMMRRWYTTTGGRWLSRRIQPWAARFGVDDFGLEVRDLGYRWGSARSANGQQRINIHWATMQLPPTLIDYVLVHELAHLVEPRHGPEFWAAVARVLPGSETYRASLAGMGRNVWLGTSAPK